MSSAVYDQQQQRERPAADGQQELLAPRAVRLLAMQLEHPQIVRVIPRSLAQWASLQFALFSRHFPPRSPKRGENETTQSGNFPRGGYIDWKSY